MRRPEELEPDLTAEDLQLVELLERTIEQAFGAPSTRTYLNFGKYDDKRLKRLHWDEFIRRALSAGWHVEDKGQHFLITRPTPVGSPRAARFAQGRPATNASLLVTMLGATEVAAVYDPYLDDRGLQVVLTMRNLGVVFSRELRLLGRDARRLTKGYADSVLRELPAAQGEVRVKGGRGHENRLIFLADGDVVSIGCSLNNLDVNERPHRDSDGGARAEFDADWAGATPLT